MEEITHVLTELGLTAKQAKYLLTLNKFEYATVKDISEAADVHRQEVYPVLLELQEMGLIERKIGTPNRYKAGPLSETLDILLNRKNKWMSEIQKKTLELTKNNCISGKEVVEEENDFTFITGAERFSHALHNWAANAHTIDEVIIFDRFSFQMGERLEATGLEYRDDTRIRIVTSASPETLKVPCLRGKNVDVRFVSFPLLAEVAIYNGNRAHLAVFSNRESPMQNEIGGLTSNHPCYVQMLQNYFDVLWKSAKPSEKLRL